MTQQLLPCVEISPSAAPDACVIWLHGLGDSGHGFAPIVPELKLPESLSVKFLFPHAPERPITINNGMRMRAWYDIKSLDFESRADLEGVKASIPGSKWNAQYMQKPTSEEGALIKRA